MRALQDAGIPFQLIPGLSSFSMLGAALSRSYEDWELVSLHGTLTELELEKRILSAVMTGKAAFFLLGGKVTPERVMEILQGAGLSPRVSIGENLGSPEQRVTVMSPGDRKWETASVSASASLAVLLTDPLPVKAQRPSGFSDGEFLRGKVPMTRQFVRAAVLSVLGIEKGDIVWDIGAGTGSVSVEASLQNRSGLVYAVEKEEAAVELIRKNREKFCCWNLKVMLGQAPECLDHLPAPDKVFIGGSHGALEKIVEAVLSRKREARIVLSAITAETFTKAVRVLEEWGLETEISQISVARSRQLGAYHMMEAENPVWLIVGNPREPGKLQINAAGGNRPGGALAGPVDSGASGTPISGRD